jgi:predicted PurR-regulated permease PerM
MGKNLSTKQKVVTAILTGVVVFISSYFITEPIIMAIIAGLTAYISSFLSKNLIKE